MLYLTKFKLNEAIGNNKAKVDTKLMVLVLKCTKSKLNYAISKLAIKVSNLELRFKMQYACRAKLNRSD